MDHDFEHYMVEKKKAETQLVLTELDWVILRPSALTNEPGVGMVELGLAKVHREIRRDDVAGTLVALMGEPWHHTRDLRGHGRIDADRRSGGRAMEACTACAGSRAAIISKQVGDTAMVKEIIFSDATKLAELIRTREVSPVEVVQAHLDRIEAVNPKINAIVTLADGALEAAKAAEAAVLAGDELGPLHGVPFTVKDSIDTADVLTQRGSPIFKGRVPDTDATSVARMKKAGGILLAKTNLPEFSYWIESDNLLTGRSNNPWDLERTPGGSSGGESAAIAAGMSPLGLGTDLAISVRGPAAQTGIVSLKATHGRVPMTGIWPRVPRRFWHVGPMARTVRDLALAFSQLVGPDGLDALCHEHRPVRCRSRPPRRIDRSGWAGWSEPGFGPVDPEVAATVQGGGRGAQGRRRASWSRCASRRSSATSPSTCSTAFM